MVELRGPVKRACGHTTYRAGDVFQVTPERAQWFRIQDCDGCRTQPDWKPTIFQLEASEKARESERKS
jgi:hypothetical protein